jgi:hypothetical protein
MGIPMVNTSLKYAKSMAQALCFPQAQSQNYKANHTLIACFDGTQTDNSQDYKNMNNISALPDGDAG